MENLKLIAKYPLNDKENIVLYKRETGLEVYPLEFVCWVEDLEGNRYWGRYSDSLEGGLEAFKKRLIMYNLIEFNEED